MGTEHAYRDPCRRVVELAADGKLTGEASVELVQEVAYVRNRRGGSPASAVRDAAAVASLCRLHPFTEDDLRVALNLFRDVAGLSPRDCVHAATALNRGVEAILTTDRAFDRIAGLERIDPRDVDRLLPEE
jgi:uncharacterized protein